MSNFGLHPTVSVVIPTLNEARNLPYVLPFLPEIVTEVILVDGRSTDNTIEVARSLRSDIKVVRQTGKGKGNALKAGFAACTSDIVVMLDADGSANPQEIHAFVQALIAGNDFARGTRYVKPGGSSDLSVLRRLGNFGLNSLANIFFGTHFTDLCYGYNAFWRDCLNYIEVTSDGFEVETLLHLQVCKAGLKTVEVPSFEHARIHGESHLQTWRDGWRVLKTIFKERFNSQTAVKSPVRVTPVPISNVPQVELMEVR